MHKMTSAWFNFKLLGTCFLLHTGTLVVGLRVHVGLCMQHAPILSVYYFNAACKPTEQLIFIMKYGSARVY